MGAQFPDAGIYPRKKIIVADLDGTLAVSKSRMDREMSALINELLRYKSIAVISGGMYKQFQEQFVSTLEADADRLSRLYLFPTCATALYRYVAGQWTEVYSERLTGPQRLKIIGAFETALKQCGFVRPDRLYGELIEDRGTQVTFSALGQRAPIALKSGWDPDGKKRLGIKERLDRLIPEFEVRVGGTTSIDVTRKGIDKAYGIRKIREICGFSKEEMLFVGDALFEGGNDYPVKAAGVDCVAVSGPEETKAIFRKVLEASRASAGPATRDL